MAWEPFRPELNAARKNGDKGGRPAYDVVLMFKVLVLQALYNLPDEQTEYQILDRLSFMRLLGLELQDAIPGARTIWVFREQPIAAEAVEKLSGQFDAMLEAAGFAASGGQIVDATFVEVPRQRNNRDDNETIKKGETPAGWSDKKIRKYKVTDASVPDSRELDNVLDPGNGSQETWAGSAYRSDAQEAPTSMNAPGATSL